MWLNNPTRSVMKDLIIDFIIDILDLLSYWPGKPTFLDVDNQRGGCFGCFFWLIGCMVFLLTLIVLFLKLIEIVA